MAPFTLHFLAGHADMNATRQYVHPSEAGIREAMEKVWEQSGHTGQNAASDRSQESPAIN